MRLLYHLTIVIALIICVFSLFPFSIVPVAAADNPLALIGPKDALLVTSPDGGVVFAKNETAKRIPASTLKLFTSLLALHTLGPNHRFGTDFFLDENQDLKIKGDGDPLLISEVIADMARLLSQKITHINDIILDASYFTQPILIPGRSPSHQPYDAPNGALGANFNTVKFKQRNDGRFISTEPQTPLVPFVLPKLRASGLTSGRIVLSHLQSENVLYVGHLLTYFLNQYGIKCQGGVRTGTVNPATDRLILRYASPFTLEAVISKLLEHSNNFTANQLLVAVGAHTQGPPGSLQKGVDAGLAYARKVLTIGDLDLVEGSGISRQNRLSAWQLVRIVDGFESNRHLMTKEGRVYFKTGSLSGISTRAGFIESSKGGLYRFAILMNTSGKSAAKVVRGLLKNLP